MRRFEGQSVFVTGGNKGIGYGIARRFAEEGAKVAIASVDKDTHDAARKLADETGTVTHGVILDVRDAAAVRDAYSAAEEAIGALSISVQNAGVITISKIEELTQEQWDFNLDVNTKGAFLCCRRRSAASAPAAPKAASSTLLPARRVRASSIPRITPPRSSALSA